MRLRARAATSARVFPLPFGRRRVGSRTCLGAAAEPPRRTYALSPLGYRHTALAPTLDALPCSGGEVVGP
jgi:hypothetical protein